MHPQAKYLLMALALGAMTVEVQAGFRGRGGGRGGGRSISRPVARPSPRPVARPAPRPVQRPNVSVPNFGGSRPNVSRPSINRPTTLPSGSRPTINRPTTLPSVNRPDINRPTQLPSINRPSVSRPSQPIQRPNLPGTGIKPSLPKPDRPTTLPGRPGIGNRPGIDRPNLPNKPPGVNRPSIPNLGGGNRPGNNFPNRPKLPGAGNRPSAGDVGNFLGLDKPLQRPGGVNRPTTLPARPGGGNTQINIGKINAGRNTVINNRPTWAKIDNTRNTIMHARWNGQINKVQNWQVRNPQRTVRWNRWGTGVRTNWHAHYRHVSWFNASWWNGHPHRWCGWHYGYRFRTRPWRYWWTVPAWTACRSWFTWTAPAAVWSEPIYYDYGDGGNVTYQDNSVYIGGQEVATAEEFAQSAAVLATVPPPENEKQAEESDWLALGTFAVSANEKDVDPTRILQLAVNKQGIISGTLYNRQTDKAQSVQGQVDKETQRVAFRVGESEDVVVETGLYNLTQNEAPLLVHFGDKRVENYLLVRLEQPEEQEEKGEEKPAEKK